MPYPHFMLYPSHKQTPWDTDKEEGEYRKNPAACCMCLTNNLTSTPTNTPYLTTTNTLIIHQGCAYVISRTSLILERNVTPHPRQRNSREQ